MVFVHGTLEIIRAQRQASAARRRGESHLVCFGSRSSSTALLYTSIWYTGRTSALIEYLPLVLGSRRFKRALKQAPEAPHHKIDQQPDLIY